MSLRTILCSVLLLSLCACIPMQSNRVTLSNEEVASRVEQDSKLPTQTVMPLDVIQSEKNIEHALYCLDEQLQKQFKLPTNFYHIKIYDDGNAKLSLINVVTQKQGLFMDILPTASGSEIRFYPNGSTVSNAWRKLPQRCQ